MNYPWQIHSRTTKNEEWSREERILGSDFRRFTRIPLHHSHHSSPIIYRVLLEYKSRHPELVTWRIVNLV